MLKIVLTEPMHPVAERVLGAHFDIDIVALPSGADAATIRDAIADADGIGVRIVPLRREDLEGCSRLRVIAKHGVGTDNIDRAFCAERGITVHITPDANSVSVAEHAMMLMLALAKRLAFFDAETRRGHFHARNSDHGACDLAGRTALIVGVGRTGRQLIPRLRAFGVDVIVADPELDTSTARVLGCELVADFKDALPRADILSVHVPLTPATRHLIGESELARLKAGALVINCARGGIVDEAALLAAIERGHISGAGTDVFEIEPPPSDHPFFSSDRILVTPHTAATTAEALERMAEATARNLLSVLKPDTA